LARVSFFPSTFTLLTTEPGPDVAPIHDRQMVVLDRSDWLAWLISPGRNPNCSSRFLPGASQSNRFDNLSYDAIDSKRTAAALPEWSGRS
jgi:putative SOS response-associated peptidase YedK